MVKLTKSSIKEKIRQRTVTLGLTNRLIKNPPTDSLSIDMSRQAERIRAEIAELNLKLMEFNPNKKPSTKKSKRRRK